MYSLNLNCIEKRGIVYMYYVDSDILSKYSMLNFNDEIDLIKISYDNIKYKTFDLC
jgi:hypothetical protein